MSSRGIAAGTAPDTYVLHSSQAFCISTWGAVASPRGTAVREVVAKLIGDYLFTESFGHHSGAMDLILESDSRALLNEYGGKQSHLDEVFRTPTLTVVIESKLTEPLGECSQVKNKHCSGKYGPGSDLKLGRDSYCRLDYTDGIRTPRLYWPIMQKISREGVYPSGEPCAFAGPGYQVMRNIAAAYRLAERNRTDWRVIFAFPNDASTVNAIMQVKERLLYAYRNRILILDYCRLAEDLTDSTDSTVRALGEHMALRLSLRSRV